MKRPRKTPSRVAPGSVVSIPKIPLAPVRRVYQGISVEVLTDQTSPCQDAGCQTRAALRVRWHDRHGHHELLLCAYHAQVTVAQLRERLRSAASPAPPTDAPASNPRDASATPSQAPTAPGSTGEAAPVAPPSSEEDERLSEGEAQQ